MRRWGGISTLNHGKCHLKWSLECEFVFKCEPKCRFTTQKRTQNCQTGAKCKWSSFKKVNPSRIQPNPIHTHTHSNRIALENPQSERNKIKLSYCAKRNGYSARYVTHKIPNNYGENNCLWSFIFRCVCVFCVVFLPCCLIAKMNHVSSGAHKNL